LVMVTERGLVRNDRKDVGWIPLYMSCVAGYLYTKSIYGSHAVVNQNLVQSLLRCKQLTCRVARRDRHSRACREVGILQASSSWRSGRTCRHLGKNHHCWLVHGLSRALEGRCEFLRPSSTAAYLQGPGLAWASSSPAPDRQAEQQQRRRARQKRCS
jgi:hypothetical protein